VKPKIGFTLLILVGHLQFLGIYQGWFVDHPDVSGNQQLLAAIIYLEITK
jgi:hypothetical protein